MDLDTETDEDLILALQVADELESNFVKQNNSSKINNDESDFEFALKLSQKLNNHPLTDTGDHSSKNGDFLLALGMNEEYNSDIETTTKSDYELAVKLFSEYSNNNSPKTNNSVENKYLSSKMSIVDPNWELIDPNPDIYALFGAFNKKFFWGKLDMVEVKWSPKMTLCAGVCSFSPRAGYCSIRLSKPLLQLRPRKDLVETLLHEMIHAFLFVTKNNRDRDSHGPHFHSHMFRINKESGTNITVYHSFHDEVRHFKTHWWKCDGPCQHKPPFYGYVKRAVNRAPGPYDNWHADHRAMCGGTFHKIKEPENYKAKKSKRKNETNDEGNKKPKTNILENYFEKSNNSNFTNSSKTDLSSILGFNDFSKSSYEATKPLEINNKINNFVTNHETTNTLKSFGSGKNVVSFSEFNQNKSPRKSSKSPKKWVPLPGQKNIFQFLNKS